MMSWYGGYGGWSEHVPVAKKIARGKAAAAKLAKSEGREPCPIEIEGRKIAKTFWGLQWYENLNRYRDIANRLDRGATYVRNGSVADLVIESGKVRAIVGGSQAYFVEIEIKTLKSDVWQSIGHDCSREVDSLFDLLQGRFNEGVMKRLTQAEGGLFPHKDEISMSCSCPDYATVCKHVAAVFYGIAARLDQQPELLFKLRNVNHLDLIKQATNASSLDEALGTSGPSAIAESDLSSIFGIDLESNAPIPEVKSEPGRKRRATSQRAAAATVKKIKKAKAVKKPAAKLAVETKKRLAAKPVAAAVTKARMPSSGTAKTKSAPKVAAKSSKKAVVPNPAKKLSKVKAIRKAAKADPVAAVKARPGKPSRKK